MARPIFCGNFEYDARQSDLERLFRRYGRVERVDMKAGFAFVYMEDERDADDAIRGLDRIEFGRKGRKLRVEWTKDRDVRRPVGSRKPPSANTKPSKTLFVINFDTHETRQKDLERHFESYGKIVSVRIRKNFAFVQYDSQEDATKALDATNNSKLLGRVLSVEYAVRDDDDDRRKGYSPDRSRDRSPGRRGHDRRRSPSPYRRDRGSPDYGRGPSPGLYRRERASPDYGRRRGSPSPRGRDRVSPDYGRGSSRSPSRRDRAGNDRGHVSDRSPYQKERNKHENGRGRSPSPAPYKRERASPDNGHGPSRSPKERGECSPINDRGRSHSPYGRGKASPENGGNGSPSPNPEVQPSDNYAEDNSPMRQRYDSRSPSGEE